MHVTFIRHLLFYWSFACLSHTYNDLCAVSRRGRVDNVRLQARKPDFQLPDCWGWFDEVSNEADMTDFALQLKEVKDCAMHEDACPLLILHLHVIGALRTTFLQQFGKYVRKSPTSLHYAGSPNIPSISSQACQPHLTSYSYSLYHPRPPYCGRINTYMSCTTSVHTYLRYRMRGVSSFMQMSKMHACWVWSMSKWGAYLSPGTSSTNKKKHICSEMQSQCSTYHIATMQTELVLSEDLVLQRPSGLTSPLAITEKSKLTNIQTFQYTPGYKYGPQRQNI